ncbi:hypothetical protein OIU78_010615 [Salix suchowensis]|nr:hypothetical protein OIU78_010615 [Salix suchowensis]
MPKLNNHINFKAIKLHKNQNIITVLNTKSHPKSSQNEAKLLQNRTHTLSLQFLFRLQRNSKLLRAHSSLLTLFLLLLIPSWYRHSKKTFSLANGFALFKLDQVSNFELIIGVMSLVLLLLPHPSLVLRMRGQPCNLNSHSFVTCCTNNSALH